MTRIRLQGIIVTGMMDDEYSRDKPYNILRAHEKALELQLLASNVVNGVINGYASFLIAPDGSKVGHDTSAQFTARRKEFIRWLREHPGYAWFEYAMATDEDRLNITESNITVG